MLYGSVFDSNPYIPQTPAHLNGLEATGGLEELAKTIPNP